MLPPNELQSKEFSKVIRGYSPEEVDEQLNFVMAKYAELYRENDALERRLAEVQSKYDQLKKDEESIRNAIINAQRASATLIDEANERADLILRAAKTNCDKILADFRAKIRIERDNALKLREAVENFKTSLYDAYNAHLEQIDGITSEITGIDEVNITDDEFVRAAMKAMKQDVADGIEQLEAEKAAAEKAAAEKAAAEKAAAEKAAAEKAAAEKAAAEKAAAEKAAAEKAAAEKAAAEKAAAEKALAEKEAEENAVPIMMEIPVPVVLENDESEEDEEEFEEDEEEFEDDEEEFEDDEEEFEDDEEEFEDDEEEFEDDEDEFEDDEEEFEDDEDEFEDDEDEFEDDEEEFEDDEEEFEDDEDEFEDDEEIVEEDEEEFITPENAKRGAIPQRINPVKGSVKDQIAKLNSSLLSDTSDLGLEEMPAEEEIERVKFDETEEFDLDKDFLVDSEESNDNDEEEQINFDFN